MEKNIEKSTDIILKVLKERNARYGDKNLSRRGAWGILIRLEDKLSRLENYINEGATEEEWKELFTDIAGYGIMGHMLKREGKL